jgi:hypothetical protein
MDSLAWAGKDKDGDVIVNLVILTMTPSRAVLFTYWASPDGDKEHADDIKAIVRSIKRIRN